MYWNNLNLIFVQKWNLEKILSLICSALSQKIFTFARPSQLAELSRSQFDQELFSHSTYVKFFVTFATKVPYLTFCDKI